MTRAERTAIKHLDGTWSCPACDQTIRFANAQTVKPHDGRWVIDALCGCNIEPPRPRPNVAVSIALGAGAVIATSAVFAAFALVVMALPWPGHITVTLAGGWGVATWIIHRVRSGR